MKRTPIKNYFITPEEIMDRGPCKPRWTKKKVLAWFDGRKKVRLLTILKDEEIDVEDRRWIVYGVVYMRSEIPNDWWARADHPTLEGIIAAIE